MKILTKCEHCRVIDKHAPTTCREYNEYPKGIIKIIKSSCIKCQNTSNKVYSERYLTTRMRYLLHQKCKNIEGVEINARDKIIFVPSGYDVSNKYLLKLINDFDYNLNYIIPQRPLFMDDQDYIFIKKTEVLKTSNDQKLGEIIRKKL